MDRSFVDPKLTGHLFDRDTLFTKAHGLLIACISLGAADRNGLRNVRSRVWTPFFHGDRRFFLCVCFSVSFLACCSHLGEDARQKPLYRFRQILTDVKAVGDLNCLRCAS